MIIAQHFASKVPGTEFGLSPSKLWRALSATKAPFAFYLLIMEESPAAAVGLTQLRQWRTLCCVDR